MVPDLVCCFLSYILDWGPRHLWLHSNRVEERAEAAQLPVIVWLGNKIAMIQGTQDTHVSSSLYA